VRLNSLGFKHFRAKFPHHNVYPQEVAPPAAGIPHRPKE
jgi:hypothetical protein